VALVVMAGCSKNIQTNEAVKAGVVKHLTQNSGLNVAAMDIEVTAVTFKDNEAEATVGFKPKGGAGASGMSMKYSLEKKGGEWVVKKKADSGMGHGAAMPGGVMPSSGMPSDATHSGAAAAPAGKMPADHPSIGDMKGMMGGKAAEPKK
jgi:hypothetical protein